MKEKDHRAHEGLKAAAILTFVSGFIDAFTYLSQDGRFAGMQTGNLIYMTIYGTQGDFSRVFEYLQLLLTFMCGQIFTYLLRQWMVRSGFKWHRFIGLLLLILLSLTAILTPYFPKNFTAIALAFFASVLLESFQKVRHLPYANIMLTGNVRTMAKLIAQAIETRDSNFFIKAGYIGVAILSFLCGVATSSLFIPRLGEYSLYLTLAPFTLFVYLLYQEKS